MPTANRTEYLDLEGHPFATAAYEITNLDAFLAATPTRGGSDVIPYRRGVTPRRRIGDTKRVTAELIIEGAYDSDGNPASDAQDQLEANVDELKRVLRPRQNVAGGIITANLHLRLRTLTGPAQIVRALEVGGVGPGALRGTFDIEFTDGVLYDEANAVDVTETDVAGGGSADLAVPNPGTADQLYTVLTLTGTATSVRLTNLTWDPDGDTWLEFGGALEDGGVGTTINTQHFTAVRDDLSVIGLITNSGHETWFPLLAGVDNTIRIEPVGGTATVQIQHDPAYE